MRAAPVSCTTQRVALPQLWTSPPSAFQIRMRRSDCSLGSSTISWSHPMPRRRSAMARASGALTSNGSSRASTITKSLPRPCILWKGRFMLGGHLGSGQVQVHCEGKMARAANDVMQAIIFSAVLDGIAALKRASGGLSNQLLRDIQAIHPNVTFADLPKELQDRVADSTRAAFTQLLKDGYAVGPRQQMQQSRPMDRVPERQRTTDRRGPPRGPRPPRPDGDGPNRGPR